MASFEAVFGKLPAWRIPKLYRQPLDRSWLISLVVAPLLVTGIGYATLGPPPSANAPAIAPTGGVATSTSRVPRSSLSLLSIIRNGNDITAAGDFPDDFAKSVLMNALRSALPPGGKVIDQIHLNPTAKTLDFANAGTVFAASAPISDFGLTVTDDTVTVTGTAVSADQKNAVEYAVANTWSGVNVVDKIEVKGPVTSSGTPTPAQPIAPPASPVAGTCTDLQSAINAVTGQAISFGDDGVSLTTASIQALAQVAEQLNACPNARVTINGYTDNTGSEGINIPLSMQRAKTVADFLVARGVASDRIVATGLGSVNPIAPNDTPEGRAKNRRAEIVVG